MKNKHAIRFGIFAGIGTVLFLYLFYWIEKKMMLSPSIVWSTMLLYIIAMFMAPNEEKKENGGYLSFKPALKASFLVYIIANGIYNAFNYVLYNFIDLEMLGIQKEYLLENKEVLENFLPEEQYEVFLESINILNYNLSTVLSNFLFTLFGGFVLAAIIARMVRQEPPLDMEEEPVT